MPETKVSAVFDVIDALLAKARSVTGEEGATEVLQNVMVLDGTGVSDDPGDFLMVGVESPDSADWSTSANASQAWANVGYQAGEENGEVVCAVEAWVGDTDPTAPKAARDKAATIAGALKAALVLDPTIGLGPTITVRFGERFDLNQWIGDGATCQLIFNIRFMATRL